MVSSEKLLQATLNRLSTRIGLKLIASANEMAETIKTAPEKVRTEWELFQEEVFDEAERLQNESNAETSNPNKKEAQHSERDTLQEKIDLIRAKVEELSNKLEANS